MASSPNTNRLAALIAKHEAALLDDWLKEQFRLTDRKGRISDGELKGQSEQFLAAMVGALQRRSTEDIAATEWAPVRAQLAEISLAHARLGFSPSETATFVFSLKRPVFSLLRAEFGKQPDVLADEIWATTLLLDQMGLYTTEVHQKAREEVIARQQREVLELSTPVVQLWDGILALPMIGTLDSERTQIVMETLLSKIVQTEATIAIIDITGVATVDTLVAQHLLKTVSAARLMGADCIISGIRPQIAQTIVHLGVDLADVTSKATLADAFALALERTGTKRALPMRAT